MHPSGLRPEQIREIQDLWHQRTTIESLAHWFDITTDMVRKIIAMPYNEDKDN